MEEKVNLLKRRGKIVYLPVSFVARILTGLTAGEYFYSPTGEYFYSPTFKELPEDIEVSRVMAFPERDAFGFIVKHPSFEETPEGGIFPEIILKEMFFRKVKIEAPAASGDKAGD